MDRILKVSTSLFALGGLMCVAVAPLQAQDTAPPPAQATDAAPAETTAPDVTETAELREPATLRNLLRRESTSDEDAATALAELAAQAETDPVAAYLLGDLYARGSTHVEVDVQAALPLLEFAADNDDVAALKRLGALYRSSDTGLDPMASVDYYRRAAELGDADAAYRAGEILRRGTNGEGIDVEASLEYYRIAAEAGDVRSQVVLGTLYSNGADMGLDPAEGLAWLERAAAEDTPSAYYRIGEYYRLGRGGTRDPEAAAEAYQQALEGGNEDSLMRLATLYSSGDLGNSRRGEAVPLLEQGIADGVSGAPVALARLLLSSNSGVSRDPARARSVLDAAVADGDAAAARYLIRMYTEGRTPGISRSPTQAKAVLDAFNASGADADLSLEGILINVAELSGTSGYAAIGEGFQSLPANVQRSGLLRVYTLNRNAYVYLLQNRLSEEGLFTGNSNGLLTNSTIAAINSKCQDAGITAQCRFGPLSSVARRAISETFF